jgi:hypothetical protein
MKEDLKLALRVDIRDALIKLGDIEEKFKELQLADIEVDADTTEFINSIKKASNYAKNKAKAIQKYFFEIGFAIRGAKEVFQLFADVSNQLTEPASEIEQLKIRLSNLYGSAEKAGTVYKRFIDVAKTTPYALSAIGEAGAQLKAFGVEAEENIKHIADLAAYMDVTVPEAASAMGRAFAGGAGAADVLRERGILELIKSFSGVEDLTTLTLPEFRKAMIETLKDPAAGIAGATTKMANSYAGAISNMKDAWELFRAELGQRLTPVLANVAREATKMINSMAPTEFEKVTEEASKQRAEFESLVSTYEALRFEQGEGVETNSALKETISKLKTKFGDYMQGVDLATISQKDFNKAVTKTSEELIKQAANKAVIAKKQDLMDAIGDARVAWIKNIQDEQSDLQVWRSNLDKALQERKDAVAQYDADMASMGALNPETQKALETAEDHVAKAREILATQEKETENNIEKINNEAKTKIAGLEIEIKQFSDAYSRILDDEDMDVDASINFQSQFNEAKAKIDEEYSRNKKEHLQIQLETEQDHLQSLADNEITLKKAVYTKIKEIEKEIAEIEADEAERRRLENERRIAKETASEEQKQRKLKRIKDKYATAFTKDRLTRIKEEIVIEREAAIAEASAVTDDETVLANIREFYRQKEIAAVREFNLKKGREVVQANARARRQEQDLFAFTQLQNQDDPLQAQLNAQLRALEQFFIKKHDSLIASGVKEQDLEETKAQAIARIRENIDKQRTERQNREFQKGLKNTKQFFGNMSIVAKAFGKEGFKAWKHLALAQAYVDTFASANAAYKSLAGIPVAGPGLAVAAAGAAIASGLMNVKKIEKTQYKKGRTGGHTGLLAGPSHEEGGVVLELEGKEYVINKERVAQLGVPFFDFINSAPINQVEKRLNRRFELAPLESIKDRLSDMFYPDIPLATGDRYAGFPGNPMNNDLLNEIKQLRAETKGLRDDLNAKEMVVNNNLSISADEVIDKASNIKINESNEAGKKERDGNRW